MMQSVRSNHAREQQDDPPSRRNCHRDAPPCVADLRTLVAPRPVPVRTRIGDLPPSQNVTRVKMRATRARQRTAYGDPLRTSVDRVGPIPQSARRPGSLPLHRIPACITMHGRSPAKLPDVCRDPPGREVSLTAAKDRTFESVRPNQGTASGTVPIRRWPSL